MFLEYVGSTVPVMKPDRSVRFCGDYQSTINTEEKLGDYFLLNIEALLASLQGGVKFTKLGLKQAYLQLLLNEKRSGISNVKHSQSFILFKKLQFKGYLATGIFHRAIKRILGKHKKN